MTPFLQEELAKPLQEGDKNLILKAENESLRVQIHFSYINGVYEKGVPRLDRHLDFDKMLYTIKQPLR